MKLFPYRRLDSVPEGCKSTTPVPCVTEASPFGCVFASCRQAAVEISIAVSRSVTILRNHAKNHPEPFKDMQRASHIIQYKWSPKRAAEIPIMCAQMRSQGLQVERRVVKRPKD